MYRKERTRVVFKMHSNTFWICTWISLVYLWSSAAADNSPPVLQLDRNWLIEADELPGAVVVKVRAQDDEGDPLVFGLEAADTASGPLPFRIDNATGVVYINESLSGRGGESLFLYVTVTDGKYHTKSAVIVTIAGGREDSAAATGSSSGGNATRQSPRPADRPRPPIFLQNGFGHSVRVPQPPTPVPSSASPVAVTSPTTTAAPTTTTIAAASQGTSAAPPSPPTTAATTASPAAGDDVTGGPGRGRDLASTVVPISVVSCLVIVGVLLAVLFRKRLFRTRSKSATKHDLRKASNSGVATPGEPMALQHWRGPRAHSNRYEAWDGDNPPSQQVAGTQAPPGKVTDRWEFPRHRLKVFNILGEGCFGQVWRCEAQDIDGRSGTSVVAVKTLKENASEKERADLIQELQVMKMLEPHPNVVRLLGCCTEKDPVFLIMEYVSRGKLQSYLRNSRAERYYGNLHGASNSLTSRDLTTFVYQVARGMDFLSGKGIIHRDLAARNVLVDDGHVCKVADFGFARDIIASHVYERKSEGRLPIRWMAPESLYDNVFSVKSDVWSFGVLVWEVVTLGSTPYPGLAAADVMRKVRDGYRLDKPEHCRRELYNIMYYCWDSDPKDRPTFQELVQLLEALLLSETEYIELERFPDHSYYNMVSLSNEKL